MPGPMKALAHNVDHATAKAPLADRGRSKRASCKHCGTSFTTDRDEEFCCHGCRVMHDSLNAEGLSDFYRIRSGRGSPAANVTETSAQSLHAAFFESLDESLEEGKRGREQHLSIQGVRCSACAWLIERLFERHPGAQEIEVCTGRGELTMWVAPSFSFARFAETISRFGYTLGPPGTQTDRKRESDLLLRMGVTVALALNSMMFSVAIYFGLSEEPLATLFHRLLFVIASVTVLVGGMPFFQNALAGLRMRVATLDLPISIGIIVAFVGSSVSLAQGRRHGLYFDSVTVFVALMLVGRYLRERLVTRHQAFLLGEQAFERLFTRKLEGGRVRCVPVRDLKKDDNLVINPGDLLPVRAELLSNRAAFSQDWITGESDPHVCLQGDLVPGGSFLQGTTSIRMRADERFSASNIRRLTSQIQSKDLPLTQHTRWWSLFSRSYVIVVITLAAVCFTLWWAVAGDVFRAMDAATAILVVTCPCAVGIAIPLAHDLAHSRLASSGLFVRSKQTLDKIAEIRRVVFDKTGTLTTGTEASEQPVQPMSMRERSVLYTLAAHSSHPKATLALSTLKANTDPTRLPLDTNEQSGAGVRAHVDGAEYRLGHFDFATRIDPQTKLDPQADAARDTADLCFSRNGQLLSTFRTEETLRPGIREDIAALRQRDLSVSILSGDRASRVAAVAEDLGLSKRSARGHMTPEAKAQAIESLGGAGTMFVGDGANDCLAANQATLVGTPAIERPLLASRSDFYLTTAGLSPVLELFRVADRVRTLVRFNVGFAITYNVFAVAVAAAGFMQPWLAAVLMPLSSLTAVGATSFALRQSSFGAG